MNRRPEITSYEEEAIDAIVTIINQAKQRVNIRQNLFQLARSRDEIASIRVPLHNLRHPLGLSFEKFFVDTIEKQWQLTPTFMYITELMGRSADETSNYYYIKAVFSQPTVKYPVPQVDVSVFFRLQVSYMGPPQAKTIPLATFRIEGQHTDHDVRYVALTVDWILAVMKMKLNIFKRIENLGLF